MAKKYFVANEEDGCNMLFLSTFAELWTRVGNKYLKTKIYPFMEVSGGDHIRWGIEKSLYRKAGKEILDKTLASPKFIVSLNREVHSAGEKLETFANIVRKVDVRTLSNEALCEIVQKHHELYVAMVTPGMMPVLMDLSNDLLTTHLKETIQKRIGATGKSGGAGEYFQALTDVLTKGAAEQELHSLMAIAASVRGPLGKLSPLLQKKLEAHAREYFWIRHGYQGPLLQVKDFVKELKALVREGTARRELARFAEQKSNVLPARTRAEKELKLSSKEKGWFASARECLEMKVYRKDLLTRSIACLYPVVHEIAKRTKVTSTEVRTCLSTELPRLFSDAQFRKSLKARVDDVVCHPGVLKEALGGKAAHAYVDELLEKVTYQRTTYVNGSVGCPGVARGIVRIVNVAADMDKVKSGDVLVSIATIPELVPAMKRAGAIVTDIGGITSHAAIVARELRKPCLIGTGHATKVLVDGDYVEVDASHGILRILEK